MNVAVGKIHVSNPDVLVAVAGGIVSGSEIGCLVMPSGSYNDIGGVFSARTACPLDAVGGGATFDTVPMSTRQRVASDAFSSSDASNSNNAPNSSEDGNSNDGNSNDAPNSNDAFSSSDASSSATASPAVHVKTLCRGTIKFSASAMHGESVGQLKARLHKKLHVRTEDIRIVACGRELGDEALVLDDERAAAENGSDNDPVVTLFMVLKSTSSATVSVQVKDLSGVEKQQHELTVSSGMKVGELKKTLYKEFNALPPGEQKLICGGRVMSNAYIVGEYLPLDQRSTLMLMSQPDLEKAKSVASGAACPVISDGNMSSSTSTAMVLDAPNSSEDGNSNDGNSNDAPNSTAAQSWVRRTKNTWSG